MPPESHFLADVHLPLSPDSLTDTFLGYLERCRAPAVKDVYLLGDIFHFWVHGSDELASAYGDVFAAMRAATDRGVRVHFFPGNRDYLLGYSLTRGKPTGIEYHPEPDVVECGRRRIHLSHGDELCVGDRGYMIWRRISRNPFLLALFNRLPERWRLGAADRLSHASRESSSPKNVDIPPDLYRRILRRGADVIIHGHLHRAVHRKHEYPPGEVYVLDAWERTPNVLVYDHDTDTFEVRNPAPDEQSSDTG